MEEEAANTSSTGRSINISRKGKITIISVIIIIILLTSIYVIFFREIEVPEPGEINIQYPTYSTITEITIKFNDNSINVVANLMNWSTDETDIVEREYDRSVGDDIWYPLGKSLLKNKGHSYSAMCGCLTDREITMIDINGNEIVHGEFNSHKFHVYVQGTYTRIRVNEDSNLQKGYNNLDDLYNDMIE